MAPDHHDEGQMLWTIKETARQLAVSIRTVERLIKDGEITIIQVRRSRRLSAEAVKDWVGRVSPANPVTPVTPVTDDYNKGARARMTPEKTSCESEKRTATVSTSNQRQRAGTPATPMRKGAAAAEVQARIAAQKQKQS